MIIYNVTTAVTWQVHDAWLQWMRDTHIPEVMATQCFVRHQWVRLLDADETDGPTYAVQYYAPDLATLEQYTHQHSGALRQKVVDLWRDQCISFRSVMELVS
ncbi:MAG TPA: DUF4286 family protein [Phnomibacter sp.]|nr:DUF4286 family protein [Phnomibacter sp.]